MKMPATKTTDLDLLEELGDELPVLDSDGMRQLWEGLHLRLLITNLTFERISPLKKL